MTSPRKLCAALLTALALTVSAYGDGVMDTGITPPPPPSPTTTAPQTTCTTDNSTPGTTTCDESLSPTALVLEALANTLQGSVPQL